MVLKEAGGSRLEPEETVRTCSTPARRSTSWTCAIRVELLPDPFTLPGALALSPEALTARHREIPRDRDIVLYCTCPSEATAAKTAMTLHKLGIERVRPLRGGYDEWKSVGFPLDAIAPSRSSGEFNLANRLRGWPGGLRGLKKGARPPTRPMVRLSFSLTASHEQGGDAGFRWRTRCRCMVGAGRRVVEPVAAHGDVVEGSLVGSQSVGVTKPKLGSKRGEKPA